MAISNRCRRQPGGRSHDRRSSWGNLLRTLFCFARPACGLPKQYEVDLNYGIVQHRYWHRRNGRRVFPADTIFKSLLGLSYFYRGTGGMEIFGVALENGRSISRKRPSYPLFSVCDMGWDTYLLNLPNLPWIFVN